MINDGDILSVYLPIHAQGVRRACMSWNRILGCHVWASRDQERTCIQWDGIRGGHVWGGIEWGDFTV